MRDVMIDLETMGRKPGCPIVTIGAVQFDRKTGEIGATFYVKVDFEDALNHFEVDPNTVAWWLQQSDGARADLLGGDVPIVTALEQLSEWFTTCCPDYCVWGNGATFDISILEHAMDVLQVPIPWDFWAVRDCRTVEDISTVRRKSIKRKGTHHNALDDAIYQAEYISAMIAQLSR